MNPVKQKTRRVEALTIAAGGTEYAFAIRGIQEIHGCANVVPAHGTSAFTRGSLRVDKRVVPVFDPRALLDPAQPREADMVVAVVLTMAGNAAGIVIGAESAIVTLDADLIQRAPAPGAFRSRHVFAMAAIGRRILALVDVDEMAAGAGFGVLEPYAA